MAPISDRDLRAQFDRAVVAWPFVVDLERQYELPRFLLFAVGSRETNLTDETGDGGHGHGPWQLDDRTPGRTAAIARIAAGDVAYAARYAAEMLAGLAGRYRLDWIAALNAYNSGSPLTSSTTGHDYGPDVMDRRNRLERWYGQSFPIGGSPARTAAQREDED